MSFNVEQKSPHQTAGFNFSGKYPTAIFGNVKILTLRLFSLLFLPINYCCGAVWVTTILAFGTVDIDCGTGDLLWCLMSFSTNILWRLINCKVNESWHDSSSNIWSAITFFMNTLCWCQVRKKIEASNFIQVSQRYRYNWGNI